MSRPKAFVIKLGQIGDVIMAIPAVYALYEQGMEIDWAAGKAVHSLLACYSWMRVIPVEDKAVLSGSLLERVQAIARFWSKTAFRRYDLCALLYYDPRYRLLTLLTRSRRKLMFSTKYRSRTLLPNRHHADEYARVLLGTRDGYQEHSAAPVRPDRLPSAPAWAVSKGGVRIALVPGGVKPLVREQASAMQNQALRRWPVEHYVVVADQLVARGWEIVLLGSAEDAWIKPFFQHLPAIDCLGTLSLPEVVSVCDQCDAVVTHDTGPLHLAGLSAACIVGIFGPTDPSTRLPRRHSVTGIWGGQGFACRPCYDGRDFAPCQFNGCMHQVTPELVLRELDRLLLERAQGTPQPWRVVSPIGT